MCFTIIRAPNKGLVYQLGKPGRVLEPGVHLIATFVETVKRISCSLRTADVDIDVITRGGTPTTIKIGYTARVVDVTLAQVNVADAFATLRMAVISVVSGASNSYTIDELSQNKSVIALEAEKELLEMSEKHGWGLGEFQIAIGDPSLSDELKKLLMREEAVKRENAANLDKARNQVEVAKQLNKVAEAIKGSSFAQELLRLQMLADMGEGGKVIVVDSSNPSASDIALRQT